MTPVDSATRPLAALAAALLDCGGRIHGLSLPLTVAALVLALLGVLHAPEAQGRITAILIAAALAGLAETYLAIRVDFDAALFRGLAAPAQMDIAALDHSMRQLRLLPEEKIGRPFAARMSGARRLLRWQAAAVLAQIGLILLAIVTCTGG